MFRTDIFQKSTLGAPVDVNRSPAESRELITAIIDMSCREDGLFVFVVTAGVSYE